MASCLSIQPNPEEVWRKDRGAMKERLAYYVGNEFLADVTFVVGVGAEKRSIPAHRFILSTCSWDFYNVTYLLQLDNNEIPIPDVRHDAFLVFLKYCYTGEILFAEEEKELLLPVLKLAHRFKMEHLAEICEDFICHSINVSVSTCFVWSQSLTLLPKESKLRQKLLKTIAENFSSFLANEGNRKSFWDLPLATVKEIVSCDKMDCNEMQVFDALMNWAKEYCGKNNISPEPLRLRAALKDAFYKIRFPAMKHSQFVEVLAKYPNLLTPTEISEISLKMNGKTLTCEKFSSVPREPTKIWVTRACIGTSNFPNIGGYDVHTCFSDSLKIEGRSRHCSVYFKINMLYNGLTGFAVLANRNQDLKLRYCRCTKSSDTCDLPPIDSGQYYNTEHANDATNVKLIKRYHINSTHDVAFFRFTRLIFSPNSWYRFSCEFDVDLPHVHPDPLTENFGNLSVKKEKISFIPYLSFSIF